MNYRDQSNYPSLPPRRHINDADLVPLVSFLDNHRSAEDSEDEYEDDGGGFGWTGDSDDEENPLARAMLLVVSAHVISSHPKHISP